MNQREESCIVGSCASLHNEASFLLPWASKVWTWRGAELQKENIMKRLSVSLSFRKYLELCLPDTLKCDLEPLKCLKRAAANQHRCACNYFFRTITLCSLAVDCTPSSFNCAVFYNKLNWTQSRGKQTSLDREQKCVCTVSSYRRCRTTEGTTAWAVHGVHSHTKLAAMKHLFLLWSHGSGRSSGALGQRGEGGRNTAWAEKRWPFACVSFTPDNDQTRQEKAPSRSSSSSQNSALAAIRNTQFGPNVSSV